MKCPMCGEDTLEEHIGFYQFVGPKFIVDVFDTRWWHCKLCNEDILSPELDLAIQGVANEIR